MYFDISSRGFKDENTGKDKIAFIAKDKSISWIELKALSEKICEIIKKAGVPKGHPVLVYGDKESFFLASLLCCYQMKLPFIPVNNSLPKNKIKKIITQTETQVIICCGDYEEAPALPVIIKSDLSLKNTSVSAFNLIEDSAYILFTSGSSGEPKGVIISDENVISFTSWFINNLPVNKQTVFINQASFLFDISLADFFGTLQTGGTCLFNTSEQAGNANLFFKRINTYQASYWNSTPSFIIKYLADKNFNSQTLPSILYFVLSGENLFSSVVKEIKNRFPKADIINAYGPTETTVYASCLTITNELLTKKTLPVCKTDVINVHLDNEEIIISGSKVGRGYLNNDKVTRQKFISYKNEKAFATGDLGLIEDGYIYCTGRKDEQIKLNGYRIELNEIKYALEQLHDIEQAECIPIVINDIPKRLLAFIKTNKSMEVSFIKKELEKELQAYMIPSEIIVLKEFPYTNSFKVDKQKLLNNYLRK